MYSFCYSIIYDKDLGEEIELGSHSKCPFMRLNVCFAKETTLPTCALVSVRVSSQQYHAHWEQPQEATV